MSLVRVNLLYMSVYGGILVLTVLCLRLLLKNRLPKRVFSILWCVALLRLLMPFSVNSSFGFFTIIQDRMTALQVHGAPGGENRRMVFPETYFWQELYSGEDFGYNGGIGGNPGDGIITGVEGSQADNESPAESGSLQGVWKPSRFRKISMAGTIVCAAIFLALYLNCLRRFKTALPVADSSVEQYLGRRRLLRKVRVRQSDRIFSPLTYGLVRPVILLPRHLEQEDGQKLEYILQHEMVHIRRFDGAWKIAMTAALCLHWFNPLVWVMYVFMNRDLELSCDEEVLRIFGAGARKGYALTLIGMEERRHLPVPLYSGFGKNAVEERIGEIMKYKKKTKLAMGAGAALILAVVCMFATTSKANEKLSGADESLPEDIVNTDLPMDPPAGFFGETDGAGDNAGSGTAAGTDSNAGTGAVDGTEQPAAGENGYRLIYLKEGFPESEPARLVAGQGFYILLPQEGWTAFGPDGWMSEENNEVELWVAHFSAENSDYRGYDREQIIEALKGKGYQESEESRYWMYEEAKDRMTVVELRQTGAQDFWGVFYTYPGEAEDGWGVELRTMAQTFSVVTPELTENASAGGAADTARREAENKTMEEESSRLLREAMEAERKTAEAEASSRRLLQRLIEASGEEDHSSINQYLAEGYEVDTECLDWIREWKQETIRVWSHPTGDRCALSIQVITIESEADSNDYLTVEMLKEGEDWKICFMGLEK